MNIFVIYIIIIVIIIFLIFALTKSREEFQVLGSLAPFQEELVGCLLKAEKANPDYRLMSPSNFCGDRDCYLKLENEPYKDYNKVDCCEGNTACEVYSSCIKEVADWCANIWCPSFKGDKGECVRMCLNKHSVNCSSGRSWNWKL